MTTVWLMQIAIWLVAFGFSFWFWSWVAEWLGYEGRLKTGYVVLLSLPFDWFVLNWVKMLALIVFIWQRPRRGKI